MRVRYENLSVSVTVSDCIYTFPRIYTTYMYIYAYIYTKTLYMRKTSIDAYMHVIYTGAKGFILFIYMHIYIIHVYIIHAYIIHVYIKTQKKKTYI